MPQAQDQSNPAFIFQPANSWQHQRQQEASEDGDDYGPVNSTKHAGKKAMLALHMHAFSSHAHACMMTPMRLLCCSHPCMHLCCPCPCARCPKFDHAAPCTCLIVLLTSMLMHALFLPCRFKNACCLHSMQVETAQKHLHRFFFHNCVALQLIEDPDLVAAFKAVGVPLRHCASCRCQVR